MQKGFETNPFHVRCQPGQEFNIRIWLFVWEVCEVIFFFSLLVGCTLYDCDLDLHVAAFGQRRGDIEGGRKE